MKSPVLSLSLNTVMTKFLYTLFTLLFLNSCNQNKPVISETVKVKNTAEAIFSKNVSDTFYISTSLPNDYDPASKIKYPVIYVLDANLYFDIFSAIAKKYSEAGLIPPAIIIGVGYKDFQTMDSLRSRDFTFPEALAEYEMTVSGNADKFFNFLTKELIPGQDKKYNIDTTNRILMGHSLGGYFTLYALLQDLTLADRYFSSYIAASPSLDYNNGYLLKKLIEAESIKTNLSKNKVYIAFGTLEDDPADKGSIKITEILDQLKKQKTVHAEYKFSLFSDLDHMDTQIPSFVKGLQWIFSEPK